LINGHKNIGEIILVPQSDFNWEFEIPTWEHIYELLLDLASQIRRATFSPDIIVGVARGGWPPARIMSDLLENPEVANVKAEFYLGVAETKGEPVITQPVSVPVRDKKVLIVDDVADTGKSLALVKEHLKEKGATDVKIATIYYKPWSIVTPDYFERKTSHWIVFPWERKETVRRILEKCRKQSVSTEQAKETLVRYGFDRMLVERFLEEIAEGKA
jgi:hypoxanthine phosphoribosyltransferase